MSATLILWAAWYNVYMRVTDQSKNRSVPCSLEISNMLEPWRTANMHTDSTFWRPLCTGVMSFHMRIHGSVRNTGAFTERVPRPLLWKAGAPSANCKLRLAFFVEFAFPNLAVDIDLLTACLDCHHWLCFSTNQISSFLNNYRIHSIVAIVVNNSWSLGMEKSWRRCTLVPYLLTYCRFLLHTRELVL